MKKIFYILLTIIGIIGIYTKYHYIQINYVSIGDSLLKNDFNSYIYDYLKNNNELSDYNVYFNSENIHKLADDVKNNRTIWINNREYFLKKVLRESDVLVISIGMNDLKRNYDSNDINKNYRYFSKMMDMIEELLKEITKYAKEEIIFLGYFNPTNYYDSKTDEFFFEMDYKLNELMEKYHIIYLPIYETVKENNYQNSQVLNSNTLKRIALKIEYYLK